ncbi:MAG: transcription antitermination factor NusB [Desulfobacteraceae bacterium]|nr:transcription antitermination factor NusB [Desulfobacteraceae bacterium]
MGYRRLARELALQALFYFDMDRGDPAELLELFCTNFEENVTDTVKPFFLELVEGVTASRDEINTLLNRSSSNWKISRMPVVDRNIMRIAAFELVKRPDIPSSVSINEAVEIGKRFGTRGSGAFINGVLDRIRLSENID